MAITFVASSSVGSGSAISIAAPAGVQEGDLLIGIMSLSGSLNVAPTGWTLRVTSASGNILVYTKYAASGAAQNTLTATGNGSSDRWCMLAYRGAGSYDVVGTTATGTGTTATTNTITTTYADDLVLSVYTGAVNAAFSTPTGTTSRADATGTATLRAFRVVDEIKATAGVTTARASTNSTSTAWAAVAIAFVPTRTLYWVGGAGTWNTTTTGDWANTSGGSPTGILPPVQNENVIIDSSSGTGTITCTGGVCNDLTVTTTLGITLGASGSTLSIFGNMSLPSGGSFVIRTAATALAITFAGTSAKTITTNGKTLGSVTFNGVSGTWTLQSALTAASTTTLTNGTLNLNNNTLTTTIFGSGNSNTRAIQFGTGNITLTGNAATVLNMATATGFTYTGTPSVISSYTGGTGTRTFNFGGTAGGTEANALNLSVTGGTDITAVTGHYKTLTFTGYAGTLSDTTKFIYGNFTASTGMTVSSRITFAATSGTQLLTSNGRNFLSDITKTGAGSLQLQDALLNSNVTFTLTQGTLDLGGFTLTTGNFSSTTASTRTVAFGATGSIALSANANVWASSSVAPLLTATGSKVVNLTYSGGVTLTVSVGAMAEADALNFNFTAGTYAASLNAGSYGSINFTGFAGSYANALRTFYGDFTISTGMTISAGTNAQTFAKSSGIQQLTSNGKSLDFPVTKTGAGTLQLQDAMTVSPTRIFTLEQGTLDLNNITNAFTCSTFSSSNSNVRAITNPPSSAVGITIRTNWLASTATNFSVNGVNIAILDNGTGARSFDGGGLTYGGLSLSGSNIYTLTISGNNSFTTISNSKTSAVTISLTAGSTQTVTNWNVSGTVGNVVTLNSTSAGTRATISQVSGTVNVNYCDIKDSSATGGATFNAFTSNFNVDSGNNLGWIFTTSTFGMLLMF